MECVQTVMPGFLLLEVLGKTGFKVREKITLQFMTLRFKSELIVLNNKRSLNYGEDSANEERTKMT